jgi:hypothetical protein
MQGIENCRNVDEEEYVREGLTPHAQEQGVGSGNSRMDDWEPRKGIWGKLRCMDYILLELMIWVGEILEALLNLNSSHHL